jgi:O-methyltransferase involved in polyketide biosynthesis
MDGVNKTLYIPLYGKSFVSKKGIILRDEYAERIWERESFPLKAKSKSKWLAYYMAMRAAVFDEFAKEKATEDGVVLHLGCGMDSRAFRVTTQATAWIDVDFPSVIDERKRYFNETETYRMLAADLRDVSFVAALPKAERAVALMEGVSMYLTNSELQALLSSLNTYYPNLSVLVDCYTPFAAKMSKIKNPVNDVGVRQVYGVANSAVLETDTGLTFVREREMTPVRLIDELSGAEKRVFKWLYAGKTAGQLYKLYEYKSR